MSHDLATIRGSRAALDLHWVSSQIFEVLASWAGEADHAAVAVSMATTSRHLSWHVADLEELIGGPDQPDEEQDDESQPEPRHPAVAGALEAIRAMEGTTERLGVGYRVLVPRLAVECVWLERGRKPDDDPDPLVEIASAMLGDLRRDRDDGEALLTRLIVDVVTVQKVGERVLDAERRVVQAGGLIPIVLD